MKNNIDPITGEVMQTVGQISYDYKTGKCKDETGREVTLNEKRTWVYA